MAKVKKEMMTIGKEEYNHLVDQYDLLECLRACGVDNWGGWDDAMEMYNSDEE